MINEKSPSIFTLRPLPYAASALEPVISARTLKFHHGKHHAGYVANLNELIAGTKFSAMSLEEIVAHTSTDPGSMAIFHNAAQDWNHDFYWNSMVPGGGGSPGDRLAEILERDFGSVKEFRETFSKAAIGKFGSGWCWLVADSDGMLKIETTDDADTPLAHGKIPLMSIDVWEHSYYLDYQNKRADYVMGWLDELVDWSFAAKNLFSFLPRVRGSVRVA